MNVRFKKFCEWVNWQIPPDWDDVRIIQNENSNQDNASNEFSAILKKTTLPKFFDLYSFIKLISTINKKASIFSCKINFNYEIEQNNFHDHELLEYLNGLMQTISKSENFFKDKEIVRAGAAKFKIFFETQKAMILLKSTKINCWK